MRYNARSHNPTVCTAPACAHRSASPGRSSQRALVRAGPLPAFRWTHTRSASLAQLVPKSGQANVGVVRRWMVCTRRGQCGGRAPGRGRAAATSVRRRAGGAQSAPACPLPRLDPRKTRSQTYSCITPGRRRPAVQAPRPPSIPPTAPAGRCTLPGRVQMLLGISTVTASRPIGSLSLCSISAKRP
jgi:hypothetical protein